MAAGSSNDYELIVLGAGTGGYTAAFRAAQLGMNVALVDVGKIGGTCLTSAAFRPKRSSNAELFARLKKAKEFGSCWKPARLPNFETIATAADQVVKRMWTGLKGLVDRTSDVGRGAVASKAPARSAWRSTARTVHPARAGNGPSRPETDPATGTSRQEACRHPCPTATESSPRTTYDQGRPAEEHRYRRRRRGRSEFAFSVPRLGVSVTLLEYLPAIVPARGP